MSNTSLDLEDDINKIINEVEDLGVNDDHIDIDDILNEDENSQLKSSGKKQNQIKNGYFPQWTRHLGKNMTEKYEHPLKLLESYERNIAAELGGQADLDSKFLLCNYRSSFESKFSNVLFKDLEIDQLTNNIHFAGQANSPRKPKEFWGTPKCIAILPPKYVAIGTSNSVIMVFDYNQTSYQKIGTKKEQEYGEVTAIDLSVKDDSLASGYHSGHIILWGIQKSEQIMVVNPTESGPILCLKFWKDTKHNLIASNSEGFVYLYRLDSVFFQWIMDRKVILSPNNEKRSTTQESAQLLNGLPDGFITIQLLKSEQKHTDETSPGYFVALGSSKMVLIVSLEPTIAKVFKYIRPLDVGYSNIPSVSWGYGSVMSIMGNNDKQTLLSIAWGNYVDVFQFKETEVDYAKMVKYLASYRSATEISHHEWISENNLLLYDPRGKFRLVSTSILKPRPSQEQPEEQDNSKLATMIPKQDPDVAFYIYNHIKEDEDFDGGHYQRPILYYSNTVLGFSLMRRVFILGFKKAYYVKHLEWKEYLEVLKSKADWLSAMTFFVILYQGSEKSFAGLTSNLEQNRKLLQPHSITLTKDFINSIREINGTPEQGFSNDIWKTSMLTIMDFLVEVDNFEYLFTDVRKMFKSWHMQEDFFLAMEAFILRNRIKRIPNECLRELIEQYIPQGKIDVVEYLIMNLWLKYVDIDATLSLCMEFNLLTALMYLCSHRIDAEGPDFLTPIARALSTYQKSIEEENPNRQDYGLKFLWFLDMILQGKMFPHGRVPDYLWRERIKDIMMLVFEQANLGLMLQIDPHISFEIFQRFFESDFTTFLETFKEDAIKLIGDINEDATTKARSKELGLYFKKILQMFTEVSDNKLKTQMLALIYYCSKRNKESHNMLYYTLAKLVDENKIDLPNSVVEESLIYLLKNARVYPVWENITDQKQGVNDDEDDDPEDLQKDERIRIILVLLKKIEGRLSSDKLKEIADLANLTDFVDVRVYLLQIDHQYKRCFDLYLNQPSKKKRVKIFYWLEATIPKLRDGRHSDHFKDVIDSILYRLRELVSISSEKTRRIILNLDQKLEDEVIRQLQPFPNLQLEYLNGLFAQRETTEISDALLILYIKLLCQLDPKQVIKELTTYTYPLDACIKLCKEYDVKDAYALLLERAGNPSEALKITLELFRSSLEQKVKKIEKEKIFNKSGSLLRKLNSAKDICRKYNRPGDAESESLWFYVLDSILACYSDYVANNKAVQDALKQEEDESAQAKAYRKLGRAYLDYIANLFEDMSKCVAIENILTKFEDFGSLKLGDLKTPILGMLKAYYYESAILKDTRALTMGDMFDNLGDVYYSVKIGSWCYKPNLGMYLGEDVVLFNCGHLFVRDMLKGNLCSICCDREALKVQNAINNVKKGVHMRGGRLPTNLESSQEKGLSPTQSPEIKKKMKHNLQKKENLKKLWLFDKVHRDQDDWFNGESRQNNFHTL